MCGGGPQQPAEGARRGIGRDAGEQNQGREGTEPRDCPGEVGWAEAPEGSQRGKCRAGFSVDKLGGGKAKAHCGWSSTILS